ncbi:hypothetical protein BXZ70DRAFT_495340 [Cristinia sonorae]|uniref:Uncharacterized protein n=1 Tax=Cristinia sonorae TaxID=1940300 RepID=A0A8K0UHM0_9AGAR|nr:hypothetical protein BXZ70DRAFT_495340 [Cristinia sonorae]
MSSSLRTSRKSLDLPVDVWEEVIDHVARPDPHVWEILTLRTADRLEHVARRLTSTAGLSDRVQMLIIDCFSGAEQSWVPLVPLRLPRLCGLKILEIAHYDLTMRPPNLYELYRLFDVDHLRVWETIYSRYSQITQLASAVSAKKLTLAGQVQSYRAPTQRPGRLMLGAVTALTRFTLLTTWRTLQDILRTWTFPPTIRKCRFNIIDGLHFDPVPQADETIVEDDAVMWERLATLYLRISSPEKRGECTFGQDRTVHVYWEVYEAVCMWSEYVKTEFDEIGSYHHKLRLSYCGVGPHLSVSPQVIILALRSMAAARIPLHEIVLPHLRDEIVSQFWDSIDDCLVNPDFTVLKRCDIITAHESYPHVEKHPTVDEPYICLHEEYRERMPLAASRGFFRCDPRSCKLLRSSSEGPN